MPRLVVHQCTSVNGDKRFLNDFLVVFFVFYFLLTNHFYNKTRLGRNRKSLHEK